VTIKITLEIAGNAATPLAMIEPEPPLLEAEGQYCDRRASEVSERIARLKWDRIRRLVVYLGLWGAGLLFVLIVGTLAFSIFANPMTAIGASAILTVSLRAIVQLVGRLAAQGDPNRAR
jgi:hypothetical protein